MYINKKREGTSRRRRGQEEREKVREIACTYDEESLQCWCSPWEQLPLRGLLYVYFYF